MIDCGACGGKGSAKELNLPIVKGLVGDKTVDVLRDTGCEGVVVRRGLVDDDQLTGKCCLIVRIDNTVLLAEKARIQVKTPYLSGEVEALCIPEVICDLVVGNVPGARNPDDTDTTAVVGAVTTRAQARQEVRHRPLTVPDTPKHTGVDQRELIRLQQDVEAIKRMGETVMSENRAGRTSFFEEKEGIVYRVYNDATRGGANVRQVVLPEGLRKYVMSSAHDTTTGGHSGIKKTREKIMSNFYWPGIYKDVARYCRSCDICQKTLRNETSSRVLDVSSQTRDDLNVPSCVAVVEDYDYEADNGQDNLAGDEQGSEDLPEIGTWAQKEDAADVKFGEALTYDQNRELQMLVQRFSEIFSDRPGDTNLAEHRIDLTSDVPVRQTPYAVPFALKSSLKKELQQMEDLGIIRKSDSPYASPVVVVKKKDVSNRICIDFRRLNKITVTDLQPVPSPAESFLGMSEDKYFSKLDLTKGYHQIRVRPSDVHKTAFVTMGQHYEFLRMPFGMVNSGMTMTRAVRRLLEGMDNVVDYIDDLLVHTKTWEEHLQVLEELFERLKAANLVANWEQHRLGRGTVGLQDCNVEKVKDAPRPTTKKEIRSFLGLVCYYQPFIPNFAAIAAPMSDLTRKGQPNKIVWREPQERAYAALKKAVISKPILVLPDVNKEFVLRTDASDIGLGATLLQNRDGHIFPVAYASRKLLDREKRYSVMERECLGSVWGIKKFALYLYGKQFTLQTDHRPLEFLKVSKFDNPRIMRWVLALQSFVFRVEHIKGKDNVGADFLSRVPV